jgi:hypothetical protein
MNNNYFKNGEFGLKLHLAEAPSPAPGARHRGLREEPTNPFGLALCASFAKAAMSQMEFSELLSIELRRPVSQVNVSNWLHGVEPRSTLEEPNLADAVLKAAERIAETETQAGQQKYADPNNVKTVFATWDAAGLTPKQIQLAAEISVSLYRAWRAGTVKIRTARWEVAKAKVDLWTDFVAEHQKSWQAASGGPAAKSTLKTAPSGSDNARK